MFPGLEPINPVTPALPPIAPPATPDVAPGTDTGFSSMLGNAITDANSAQLRADAAVNQIATGQGGNIHQVMLAMEQARLSMMLLVETRNKVVEAYQELSRMAM